jgi:hypothetical protein
MPTLHIEHPIRDYDTWKAAFERDPAVRQQGGVRRYRVLRPIDDPKYVMIDLDFDTSSQAEAFLAVLRRSVWQSPQAAQVLGGSPQARIVEVAESKEY